MSEHRILVVHGGTSRLNRLVQLIQDQGFAAIVSQIPIKASTDFRAVIFAGGFVPAGHYKEVRMWSKQFITSLKAPFLGICLGHLMLGLSYGATYRTLPDAENGTTSLSFLRELPILPGLKELRVWEDHVHELVHLPPQLRNYAASPVTGIQVIKHLEKDQYGVQFHPEAEEESSGRVVLDNFLRMVYVRV